MQRFHMHTTALGLLPMLALAWGCSREAPGPPPAQPAPAPPPAAPAPLPSPVDEAAALLEQPITGAAVSATLLARAEALAVWAADHVDHADVVRARRVAARLLLSATAAEAGDADAARLRTIAELTEGDPEASAVRAVALAMLHADSDAKGIEVDRAAAIALARGTTLEGLALRAAWLKRLERALALLQDTAPELAAGAAIPAAGRLLCPRCADTHHVTPDQVSRLLLDPRNAGGVVCKEALAAAGAAETPEQEIAALALCDELQLADPAGEPLNLWSTNAIAIAIARMADELSAAPLGEAALAPVVKVRAAAVRARLDGTLLLPVPWLAVPLDAEALAAPARPFGAIDGLGPGGLGEAWPALPVLLLGPDGLRAGLRASVGGADGGLASLAGGLRFPASGVQVLPGAALAEAQADEETGAIEAVSASATQLREAVDELARRLGFAEEALAPAGATALLVLDAGAAAEATIKVIDALTAAGFAHLRVAKTATAGRVLPLLTRDAPAPVVEALAVGFERPVVAVVAADHVDVWEPAKPASPAPEGKDPGATPAGASPAYRGERMVRLRVPVVDGRLDAKTLAVVDGAIQWFRSGSGAGPLVEVIADEGARAADVVRVARTFQERPGQALADPQTIWPGTRCGGPGYAELRKSPSGCATGVAVAFSRRAPPSSRGLRDKPSRAVKGAPKPTPEPKPEPPAAGFCDKADLRLQRGKAKRDFRFCFEREAQQNSAFRGGNVTLLFTIGTDGGVSGASASSSAVKSSSVKDCLVKAVKRIRFKKPEGGVCRIRWPTTFTYE